MYEFGDYACKKIFHVPISEDLQEHKHQLVSEFIGHHICKQNALSNLFIKVIRNCFCNYYVSYSKSHKYLSWLNFVKTFIWIEAIYLLLFKIYLRSFSMILSIENHYFVKACSNYARIIKKTQKS